MRVLYFGTYERDYPRNAQVISCLRGAGVEVVEKPRRPVGVASGTSCRRACGRSCDAARAEIRLARRSALGADVVIVGYPGHIDMAAARRVAGERPLVFNPLVSLEDTMVGTVALCRSVRCAHARCARSTAAPFALRTSSSRTQAPMLRTSKRSSTFRRSELAVCYVGAEDRLFRPGERSAGEFTVLFVGKLIPLHGVETILRAASACPEIAFRIVGSGQLDEVLARDPGECSSRALGGVRPASRSVPLRGMRARHLRHVGEGRTRHPEQGLSGPRDSNAADHRGHTSRAGAPRGRARRAPRASREPGSAGPGDTPGRVGARPVLEHRRTREDDIRGERVRRGARPQVASAARAAETLVVPDGGLDARTRQIAEAAALDSDEESVYLERRTENGQRGLGGGLLSASSDARLS